MDLGDCTAVGKGNSARFRAGERQQWCATCERWPFAADLAACPVGQRDEATEQAIDDFYAKENRRWIRPKNTTS